MAVVAVVQSEDRMHDMNTDDRNSLGVIADYLEERGQSEMADMLREIAERPVNLSPYLPLPVQVDNLSGEFLVTRVSVEHNVTRESFGGMVPARHQFTLNVELHSNGPITVTSRSAGEPAITATERLVQRV